jgi:phage terminase large subunit GpA-like protein
MRPQRLRSILEFALQEIRIPDLTRKGDRFTRYVQPWAAKYLEEISKGGYERYVLTGPTQSGKTLAGFVIEILYHLFEIGETVVVGVPNDAMALDKWIEDILPAIMQTRYKDLLPDSGVGSKGGSVIDRIKFKNGATLRFMSAGGDAKELAGFSTRVLVITEVNRFKSKSKDEGSKLDLLIGRTNADPERRVIYLECTQATEDDPINEELLKGTNSRLALPCWQCRQFVTPEREHLIGWQDGADQINAGEKTRMICPSCQSSWSEDQRRQANLDAVVLAEGQSIVDGKITGEAKKTRTFSLRYTATNNMFWPINRLGEQEWEGPRSKDPDNAEIKLKQQFWAIPTKEDILDLSGLEREKLLTRQGSLPRSQLPAGYQGPVVAIDIGKYQLHWTAKAWDQTPIGYTIDYGSCEVNSRSLGDDVAIRVALRMLRDELAQRFVTDGGEIIPPALVFVDSGYFQDVIWGFCQESNQMGKSTIYMPTKGIGYDAFRKTNYARPKSTGNAVVRIGDGWHVVRNDSPRIEIVHIDADLWKTRTHARLSCNADEPGALLLFFADDIRLHMDYCKHLTAEQKEERWNSNNEKVVHWVKKSRANHWLDTEVMAGVAGDYLGIRPESIENPLPPGRRAVAIPAWMRV